MSGRRYLFGLDESGSIAQNKRSVIVAVRQEIEDFRINEDVSESGDVLYPKLCMDGFGRLRVKKTRPNTRKKRGYEWKMQKPEGDFKFVQLDENLLKSVSDIYEGSRTRAERSLNGKLPETRLRADAMAHVLVKYGFNPLNDIAYVDSFGRCVVIRNMIIGYLQKALDLEVPSRSVKCKTGADENVLIVNRADAIAYSIFDRISGYEKQRISFDTSDILSIYRRTVEV